MCPHCLGKNLKQGVTANEAEGQTLKTFKPQKSMKIPRMCGKTIGETPRRLTPFPFFANLQREARNAHPEKKSSMMDVSCFRGPLVVRQIMQWKTRGLQTTVVNFMLVYGCLTLLNPATMAEVQIDCVSPCCFPPQLLGLTSRHAQN